MTSSSSSFSSSSPSSDSLSSSPTPLPPRVKVASLPHRLLVPHRPAPPPPPPFPVGLARSVSSSRQLRHPQLLCGACSGQSRKKAKALQSINAFPALYISGWAWDCVDCSTLQPYHLCQSCYDKGLSYHQHPSAHHFLRMTPPPPSLPPTNAPARSEYVSSSWYREVKATEQAWSWEAHTVTVSEYEARVYNDAVSVLVGWFSPSYPTQPGDRTPEANGISLLVSSYLPFLARLLKASGQASGQQSTLRCLLFLNRDPRDVDGEWMEVTSLGGSAQLATLGDVIDRDGGCYLCPAHERKGFLPVERRDVPYTAWYPEYADEEAGFTSPLGDVVPPSKLFVHWLEWVHATLPGNKFKLAEVKDLAVRYSAQLEALARAAATLRRVHEVSMALHVMSCDFDQSTLMLRSALARRPELNPWCDPALEAPLAVLSFCAGPHRAVEDIDVKACRGACDELLAPMEMWAERMEPLWPLLAGVRHRMLQRRMEQGYQERLVDGSGHSVMYSKPLVEAGQSPDEVKAEVVEVVASQWREVVGQQGKDVLVGFATRTSSLCPVPLPSLRVLMDIYLPAFAQVLRRYQERQGSDSAQHGGSLVIATFEVGEDPFHGQQVDVNWQWLSSDTFRDFLHPERGTGVFALYPSGSGGVIHSVFDEGMWTASTNAEKALQLWLLQPFRFPSLSDLIRFVHRTMQGGTFDLALMLQLCEESGAQRGCDALQSVHQVGLEWSRAAYRHSRVLQSTLFSPVSGLWALLPDGEEVTLYTMDVEKIREAARPCEERLAEVRPALQAAERRLLNEEVSRRAAGLSLRSTEPQPPSLLPSLNRMQAYVATRYLSDAKPFLPHHPTADVTLTSSPALGWSAVDVLQVMDEAAYSQYFGGLTIVPRWPVLDADDRMVVGARMSVLHVAGPNVPHVCSHWLLVFQLLWCQHSDFSLSLLVIVVAPSSTSPSSHVDWQAFPGRPFHDLVVIERSTSTSYNCPRHEVDPTATSVLVSYPTPTPPSKAAGSKQNRRFKLPEKPAHHTAPVGQDESWYAERGVRLFNPPQNQRAELYEAIVHDHRAQLLIGEEELASTLSSSLNLPTLSTLLSADDWHHRELAEPCELPSQNPTFQAIARAIETGKRGEWDELLSRPGYKGNTHRSHWTNGCTPEWSGRYWSRPRGTVTTV